MSKQKNILLFILLALQAALIVFLYRPGQNAAAPQLALFTNLVPAQVTALTITDDAGKSITLTKSAAWKVGEAGFPGDQETIDGLLAKISALQTSRLVTKTKGSHGRLKVSDTLFNKKVAITQQGGDITFFIGTSPNSKSVHIRRAGENEVYQVSGLATWEVLADVSSWWQSKYVAIDDSKLQSVLVTNALGSLAFSKNSEGKWQLEGIESLALDSAKVDDFLASINNISLSEYLASPHTESSEPAATITYTLSAGEPITLQIWPGKEENDDQAAKISTSDFYATIRAYVLKDILEAQADGFLAAPEESAKEKQ